MSSTPPSDSKTQDPHSPVPSLMALTLTDKKPSRIDSGASRKEEPVHNGSSSSSKTGVREHANDRDSSDDDENPDCPSPPTRPLSPITEAEWALIYHDDDDTVDTKHPLGLGADGRKNFFFPKSEESYLSPEQRKNDAGLLSDSGSAFALANKAEYSEHPHAQRQREVEELINSPAEAMKKYQQDNFRWMSREGGLSPLVQLGTMPRLEDLLSPKEEEVDVAEAAGGVMNPLERLEQLQKKSRNMAKGFLPSPSKSLGHRRAGSEAFVKTNRALHTHRSGLRSSVDGFSSPKDGVEQSKTDVPADIVDLLHGEDSDSGEGSNSCDDTLNLTATPKSLSTTKHELSETGPSAKKVNPLNPELEFSPDQRYPTVTTTDQYISKGDMHTILKSPSSAQAINTKLMTAEEMTTPQYPSPKKSVRFSSPISDIENVPMMELATPAVLEHYKLNLARWSPRLANLLGAPTRKLFADGNGSNAVGGNRGGVENVDAPRTPEPRSSRFGFVNEIPGSIKRAAHDHFFTPGKSPSSTRVQEMIGTPEAEPTDAGLQHLLELRGQIKVGGGTGIKNDQPEEHLNLENLVRWIIFLAFYMRFLKSPSFLYAGELMILLVGMNQTWLAVKPFLLKALGTIGWVTDEGFNNFVRDTVVYLYNVLYIALFLILAIVLSPAFWTVTLATLLYMAIVYREHLVYLFYPFVGAVAAFSLVKFHCFMEKRHNGIMRERSMAKYHAKHGTPSKTDEM